MAPVAENLTPVARVARRSWAAPALATTPPTSYDSDDGIGRVRRPEALLVGRGSPVARKPLAVILPDPSADDPFAGLPVPMSAELKTWLLSSELDAMYRLPDGTLVALGPPERISPGFAFLPLSRPWRRGEPATTNYKIALDGTITKRRRLSATHIESTEMPFGPADLVPTGALAERCDDCGAVSFTRLRDRDHHVTCGRP